MEDNCNVPIYQQHKIKVFNTKAATELFHLSPSATRWCQEESPSGTKSMSPRVLGNKYILPRRKQENFVPRQPGILYQKQRWIQPRHTASKSDGEWLNETAISRIEMKA
jgi:hypothetical protein